ncbi:hypothetical protein F4779DRAFT_593220 [Xylariaceae sp. FL0662B]|nr:hypothetical protein F4779DRAFT_593220 [Xylariaceae sp. FL0662B]
MDRQSGKGAQKWNDMYSERKNGNTASVRYDPGFGEKQKEKEKNGKSASKSKHHKNKKEDRDMVANWVHDTSPPPLGPVPPILGGGSHPGGPRSSRHSTTTSHHTHRSGATHHSRHSDRTHRSHHTHGSHRQPPHAFDFLQPNADGQPGNAWDAGGAGNADDEYQMPPNTAQLFGATYTSYEATHGPNGTTRDGNQINDNINGCH